MPEIRDGNTDYDFVNLDILQGLKELEQEDEENDETEIKGHDLTILTPEAKKTFAEICKKKSMLIKQHRRGKQLSAPGVDPSKAINRARSKSREGKKRKRDIGGNAMKLDGIGEQKQNKKLRLIRSEDVIPGSGYKDSEQKIKAIQLERKSTFKRNKEARKGEGDRVIVNLRPKHLFAGKRSKGKTQRG